MLYQNPVRLNLLPHREALVESHKKLFATRAILVAVLAAVLMLLAWQVIDRYIVSQQERNTFLSTEVKKLDQEIAQIATLQQEIDALKARQKAVEDLQSDRNLPVYVFEELASYVPEGVFLKTVRQDVKKITISGLAQTQERVSEMLRNFTNASVWLEQPELLEIKLANNYGGIKTSEKLYEFTIAVLAKREKKTLAGQNLTVNSTASPNSNLNANPTFNNPAFGTQNSVKSNSAPVSGANTTPSLSTAPATTSPSTVMPTVKKP
jgi:type IV pilus assembly protein PilN